MYSNAQACCLCTAQPDRIEQQGVVRTTGVCIEVAGQASLDIWSLMKSTYAASLQLVHFPFKGELHEFKLVGEVSVVATDGLPSNLATGLHSSSSLVSTKKTDVGTILHVSVAPTASEPANIRCCPLGSAGAWNDK